jgi:hypothetical protein
MMVNTPTIGESYASTAASLKDAFQEARVVVVDFQISNLALHRPALVELAAVELIGSKFGRMLELEIMPMALKPNTEARFQSQRSRDIATLPHFHEVANSIVDFIGDAIVIFSSEREFALNYELRRCGLKPISPFKSYPISDLKSKRTCSDCLDHIGDPDALCYSLAPASFSNSSLSTALVIAQQYLKCSLNWKGEIEWISPRPAWAAGVEEGCYSAAFMKAVSVDDIVSAEFFLARGVSFQSLSRTGGDEVLEAARNGKLEILRLLIQAGAKLDFSWQSFGSPFGKQPVDPLDPDDKLFEKPSGYGRTAASYAAEAGYTDIVKALIEAGADFSRQDASGVSPLEYARREGHSAIVDLVQ